MYTGNLRIQEFNYFGYFFSGVIFSNHILMNLCTCDKSLHSLYSSCVITIVSRFIQNIIVQVKYQPPPPYYDHMR